MSMTFLLEALRRFWKQHPALLYGIALLLGFSSAIDWNNALLMPISFILLPLFFPFDKRWRETGMRFLFFISLFFASFCYAKTYYQFPTLPVEGVLGTASVKLTSLATKSTSFGKRWIYRGTLEGFTSENGSARHIPITLSLPQNSGINRPIANKAYRIRGRLKETSSGNFHLAVSKETPWYPEEGSWSFAEMRYQAKQKVRRYIFQKMGSQKVATFLAGIATGDFDDRLMSFEFGRFGLQHIMAISGFHFAIIALILSGLLRLFMNKRKTALLLIFLLSSYFVFLGTGPSIMRAWITILIALAGFFVEKRGSGLNSLGVALLLVLLNDPLIYRNMGFQFSFVTTAAILVFYPGFDLAMRFIFTKRPLSEVVEMDSLNQHGYCLLVFFRQALALTLAVNLIALPMTLFFFQKFPLMSLIYNLFFPFLVSISMVLLILGLFFSVGFPFLGDVIHTLNSYYTQFVLNFTYNMPTSLDFLWRVAPFSQELIIGYLTIAFLAGICLRYFLDQRDEALRDLSFI